MRKLFLIFSLFFISLTPLSAQTTPQAKQYVRVPGKLRTHADGTISINRASRADFQKLLGVGPVISARILSYRHSLGDRFSKKEQLLEVNGIGEKKFAQALPFITL
jgi:competence ComEA-like helix-hairpin-helix protein